MHFLEYAFSRKYAFSGMGHFLPQGEVNYNPEGCSLCDVLLQNLLLLFSKNMHSKEIWNKFDEYMQAEREQSRREDELKLKWLAGEKRLFK